MKNIITSLIILCSLSAFAQNTVSASDFDQITMDGEPAFINVKTGEIVKKIPAFTAKPSVNAKKAVAQFTSQVSNNRSVANTHKIVKGETLYSISKKYGTSIAALKTLNPDIDVNALAIDQQINVSETSKKPKITTVADTANEISSTIEPVEDAIAKTDTLITANDIEASETEDLNMISIYIVQRGETLYSISKKFKTTVAQLKSLNNLTSNELSIGQNLTIK